MEQNCFEIKESRNKFLFLGVGALVVALPLLIFTPRLFSAMTLAGTILAVVGLVMVYKLSHLKTLLRIDSKGIFVPKQGEVPWSAVKSCTTETLYRNSLCTIECAEPYTHLLVDLSMSDLHNTAELKKAMVHFSGNPQLGE